MNELNEFLRQYADLLLFSAVPGNLCGCLAGLMTKTIPFIFLVLGIICLAARFFLKNNELLGLASVFLIAAGVSGIFFRSQFNK
jgi:hypothetical protein